MAALERGTVEDEKGEEQRLRGLLGKAREELALERIFGREWWTEDGVWGFHVPGEEGEVTWRKVVDAHPVVGKWDGVVSEEMRRAGVERGGFEGEEWEAGRIADKG